MSLDKRRNGKDKNPEEGQVSLSMKFGRDKEKKSIDNCQK